MYFIKNIKKIKNLSIIALMLPILSMADNGPVATGNGAIFFHPDGTSASHWDAVRLLHYGPDGVLHWDRLPEMASYRGHLWLQLRMPERSFMQPVPAHTPSRSGWMRSVNRILPPMAVS